MDSLASYRILQTFRTAKLTILPPCFEIFRSTPSLRWKAKLCFDLAIPFLLKVNLLQASQLSNSTAFSSGNVSPLIPSPFHSSPYPSLSLLSLPTHYFLPLPFPFFSATFVLFPRRQSPFLGVSSLNVSFFLFILKTTTFVECFS